MPKISLKAARVNANLTQEELAKAIGVGLSTIKNWEIGKSFPKQPQIDKLCEVLNISYDYINFLPKG